jgi:hypothetical protein
MAISSIRLYNNLISTAECASFLEVTDVPLVQQDDVTIYGGVTVKQRQRNPITGLDRPLGFQKAEAPRFLYNRHMKEVRVSALRTGRLYPPPSPGNIPCTHVC